MASFWARIGRLLDTLLGGSGDHAETVDPAKVEAAIQLIQREVEDEARARQVARLRVADLSPEQQAKLTQELRELLKKPPVE